MNDMTITVRGTRELAERACRAVFGEITEIGPAREIAPMPLLKMLKDWPAPADGVHTVALDLPVDFDIERDMGKNNVKAVVLRVHRVTILHQGKVVGYALRTDEPGLAAIDLWERMWSAFNLKLARAH